MSLLNDIGVVIDLAIGVGILDEDAAHVVGELKLAALLNYDLHAQVLGPGHHHSDGLGVAAGVHKEDILVVLGLPAKSWGNG